MCIETQNLFIKKTEKHLGRHTVSAYFNEDAK